MTGTPMSHDDHGALRRGLRELAGAVSDNPQRTERVLVLARRRHRRHVVARVSAGGLIAAATVAGLVAVRLNHASGPSTLGPGSAPAAPTSTPTTTASTAHPVCLVTSGGASGSGIAGSGVAMAVAGSDASGKVSEMRGLGKITAVDDATLSVILPDPMPDGTTTITAAFAATTQYFDGATALTARPSLSAGDTIVFGARQRDGGTNELLIVVVHPEAEPGPGESGTSTGKESAGAAGAEPAPVKVEGEVVSSQDGTMSVRVTGGGLPADQVITARAAAGTVGYSGSAPCTAAGVPDGSRIGVVLGPPDGAGTFPVQAINVLPGVAPAKADAPTTTATTSSG